MKHLVLLILLFSSRLEAQFDNLLEMDEAPSGHYGLVLVPSVMFNNINENNQATGATLVDRSRSLLFYDIRLGYISLSGFYFGFMFAGETQDINTRSPVSTRQSMGVSFGFIKYGWALTGSLLPYSKQALTNSADIANFSEGMGYQVDVAYYFSLGRYFSVGPQLVYKDIHYGKAENASTRVNSDASSQHNVFTPMLSMMINLYRD